MTEAMRRPPVRRALVAAAAVTLAWHLVLFAAEFGLPPLSPRWFPDLGGTLVNLVALLVPLAVVACLGWWSRRFISLGHPRRPLLLLPVLAVALSYGLAGVEGGRTVLVSSAVLFLALGSSEELLSRGVVQEFLAPLGPGLGVVWPLALLHGLGDWMQVNSPGAAPLWWQVLVALGLGVAAWWLTRSSALRALAGAGPATMGG